MRRTTHYDVTGRAPRTLKEAFGPYEEMYDDRPVLSDKAVFVAFCVAAVIVAILLTTKVI